MLTAAKIILTILWLAIFYNWIIPFDGMVNTVLHWFGIFMAASHIVEVFVFLPRAKLAGGNLAVHIIQLFLFGYVHNMSLSVPEASTQKS